MPIKAAIIGQNKFVRCFESIPGHVFTGCSSVGFGRTNSLVGGDSKNKTCAKAMGGSGQIAEIHGF